MKIFAQLTTLVALAAAFFITPPTVWADSKFSAIYNVTYEIKTDGKTLITQAVDLKNLTANFYATEYSLSIGATKIENVSATEADGSNIPISVSTENDTTKIHLSFNEKIVGLNRVLSFKLHYDSTEIAVKNGFVWEVTIPKLASPENIDTYDLTLKAPKEIGSVANIAPAPAKTGGDGSFNTFSYNKDQLSKSGVNASFGDHQVFNFNLKYHLANNKIFPVVETIALPPDTETQTLTYTSLTPKPQEITVDTDGNYLAKYRLEGNQKIDIALVGQARIWNKPTNPPRSNWTADQLKRFTLADNYWETNFPSIMDKAKELKTARAIYDYVSTNLKYDYERAAGKLTRYGASVAIAQPTHAVCMEYTDLFIAMARAAGIPARELDGFAYTTNAKLKPKSFAGSKDEGSKSDILHAWPEYWNSELKTWVQIDPTWGSTTGGVDYFTKLDMNHFVFSIKGVSSVEPFPAGSYKTDPQNQTQDVDVTIAPSESEVSIQPKLSWDINRNLVAGLPFTGTVTIQNDGNSSIFASKLSLQSKVIQYGENDLGPIPPLSRRLISINGRAGGFSLSADDEAILVLAGQDAKGQPVNIRSIQNLHVQPLTYALIPWVGGLIGLIIAIYLGLKFWPRIRGLLAERFPWLLRDNLS